MAVSVVEELEGGCGPDSGQEPGSSVRTRARVCLQNMSSPGDILLPKGKGYWAISTVK